MLLATSVESKESDIREQAEQVTKISLAMNHYGIMGS